MALIIVVDDVAAIRKVLSLVVTNAGHKVIEASSGEEALKLAHEHVPDLIVSDILMPGMDGFEFVRQLRADEIAGRAHVVFHSAAYSEKDARRLARDCGVFHVVQKPAKPEVIMHAIETALKSPPPLIQSQPLTEFAKEHQRLVSNKLIEKVAALEDSTRRLQSVLSLGQELAIECEPWRLLSDFCNKAKGIVAAKYAAVGIQDGNTLGCSFTNSLACDGVIPEQSGFSFLNEVTNKRRSLRFSASNVCPYDATEDIATIFSFTSSQATIDALIAAPMATSTQVYGWLCFGEKLTSDEFTEEDEQIAITLGAQLALSYENALRLQSIGTHAKELENRIRERTAELQRSNQALEQFASIAAHDLQAPLNTIMGYMKQLRIMHGNSFDADAAESMEAVFTAARHMQQFVRDALEYSRFGGAGTPLQATESSAAVKNAMDNLAADIAANSASITCGQLPAVYADEAQLTQLFQNLIHNAIKFCTNEKRSVHIWAEPAGDEWIFSIKDNGIGIASSDLDRVFNLFTRLNGNDQYAGSGIGLAICKRIVTRHGGRIWVESVFGEGTTIHFALAASPTPAHPQKVTFEGGLLGENIRHAHSLPSNEKAMCQVADRN